VGVYGSETAVDTFGRGQLSDIATLLTEFYAEILPDFRLSIEDAGTVDVPAGETRTARQLWQWWRDQGRDEYEHSQLLLIDQSQEQWERWIGYASDGGPYAVTTGMGVADLSTYYQRVIIHEIGHNLNLEHGYAVPRDNQHTVMFEDPDETIKEYSERSQREMREEIQ
jgi:hypothetical protein